MCLLFQTGLHNEFIEKFSFVTNQYMQALGGIVPIFNYMVSLEHLILCLLVTTNDDFCHLLITFANSLEPDQAWQNVGPDLDPNCLTSWWYSLNKFLKKKNQQKTKSMQKWPSMQRVKAAVAAPNELFPTTNSQVNIWYSKLASQW